IPMMAEGLITPYLDIPFQHASANVLKAMKRPAKQDKVLERIQQWRRDVPDLAIRSTFIVGFPGETEEEFLETVETCRQAQFMKIHIFPFSARRGTPAFDFPDQISPEVRKDRCAALSDVEKELALQYYHSLTNRDLEVLVERVSNERSGWVRGTDRSYAPVELPGGSEDVGQLVRARGKEASPSCVTGERQLR
ncbi:MAG: radical SAM protein, partial [Planctomycetaceae bacterium]|nr:radical SAM protein [Planctomycetaceae bacterium]